VDDSTDTYDTIEFLLNNGPNTKWKMGHLGFRSLRILYFCEHYRFATRRLKRRPTRLPMTYLFFSDDGITAVAFMLAAIFDFTARSSGVLSPSQLARGVCAV